MKSTWKVLNPLLAIVGMAITMAIVIHMFEDLHEPGLDEGVNIQAQKHDPEFVGSPVDVVQHGIYTGPVRAESSSFIVQYTVRHPNGNPRVVKTIFSMKMPYLTPVGHFVIYSYFREDGSLERDKLVEPEPQLSCSVITKWRLREFDPQGKQTEERYMRENGTVGAVINSVTHDLKLFRADGATLRYEQIYVKDGLRQIWYRKDGKTVWYSTEPDNRTYVHFDLNGKPCEKQFTSDAPNHGYSMGANQPPVLYRYDSYWRPDGTLEYKQAWHAMYDSADDTVKEVLGSVVVYDTTGQTPVQTYTLELRPYGKPRVIKQFAVTPGQVALPEQEIWFHGFHVNLWGTSDDDSHDI